MLSFQVQAQALSVLNFSITWFFYLHCCFTHCDWCEVWYQCFCRPQKLFQKILATGTKFNTGNLHYSLSVYTSNWVRIELGHQQSISVSENKKKLSASNMKSKLKQLTTRPWPLTFLYLDFHRGFLYLRVIQVRKLILGFWLAGIRLGLWLAIAFYFLFGFTLFQSEFSLKIVHMLVYFAIFVLYIQTHCCYMLWLEKKFWKIKAKPMMTKLPI